MKQMLCSHGINTGRLFLALSLPEEDEIFSKDGDDNDNDNNDNDTRTQRIYFQKAGIKSNIAFSH